MPKPVCVTYQIFPHGARSRSRFRAALCGHASKTPWPLVAWRALRFPAAARRRRPSSCSPTRPQPFLNTIPWDKLFLYWVDERCVGPDDPESNYGVAKKLLLEKVPLPPEQVFRMEGELDPRRSRQPL